MGNIFQMANETNLFEWILYNKEWVFSGIGVAVLGGIAAIIRRKKLTISSSQKQKSGRHSNNVQIGGGVQITTVAGSSKLSEKRIEDVSDFLEQAYSNLGYLAAPGNVEKVEEGISRLKSFTDLGHKASLYLSEESASAIDKFTTSYATEILNIKSPEGLFRDYFSEIKDELNKLKLSLRREIDESK